MNSPLTNQKGFNLIEVMIAGFILSILVLLTAKGVDMILGNIKRAQVFDSQANMASNIINGLVQNASLFQKDYRSSEQCSFLFEFAQGSDPDPDRDEEELSDPLTAKDLILEQYAFAWDTNGQHAPNDGSCSECRGRYDYCIRRVVGVPNLYTLDLYLYHPDFTGRNVFQQIRNYRRVVGSRW